MKYFFSSMLFLFITALSEAQITAPVNKLTKSQVSLFNKSEADYLRVQSDLQKLEQQKIQMLAMMHSFNEQQKKVMNKVKILEKNYTDLGAGTGLNGAANGGNSQDQLMNATKQMQETQMSFNLQYLQLQSQMQHENRSYTAISNIMKTKHDTAKNSISNVR